MIRLPRTASIAQLVAAIHAIQARALVHLCQDPEALARRVRAQVDRLDDLVRHLDLIRPELSLSATWWEPPYGMEQEQIIVALEGGSLEVLWAAPGFGERNGCIHLHLDEQVPR